MRIALVHMRHAKTGGAEYYLDSLARHLAERGHEVEILCRSHAEPPHARVGFRVLRGFALGGAWRMWSFARAVERHVSLHPYDVVMGLGKTWTHDVVWLGGGCQQTYLDLAHGFSQSPLARMAGSRALKHTLAVRVEQRALAPGAFRLAITNSDMVRRDAQARHGIPDEKIVTIHNGADLERFHPRLRAERGAALRSQLGYRAGDWVVLFLGTGYTRKGLDLLIEAFPELLRRDAHARLLVVGFDSARARFERRAERLGIAAQVTFTGGRPDPESWYAAADLYVLPTRYDPAAYTTLEALASGIPVITSTTNGGGELIDAHVQGSVVDVSRGADELARELVFWADEDRRRRAGRAARALAEQHAARSKLERVEELLVALAEQRAGRALHAAGEA